jgi:hypothetical protein
MTPIATIAPKYKIMTDITIQPPHKRINNNSMIDIINDINKTDSEIGQVVFKSDIA